jgi:hypothetical protein
MAAGLLLGLGVVLRGVKAGVPVGGQGLWKAGAMESEFPHLWKAMESYGKLWKANFPTHGKHRGAIVAEGI